jgi:hypothetical protein
MWFFTNNSEKNQFFLILTIFFRLQKVISVEKEEGAFINAERYSFRNDFRFHF